MKENTRKSLAYIMPIEYYWKKNTKRGKKEFKTGYYPLNMKDRLLQGHYRAFDENGIPLELGPSGELMYHVTTIGSFTFANWELFLDSGDKKYCEIILKCAEKLLEYSKINNNNLMFLDYFDTSYKNGETCAMNQGHAIGVFCRAFEISKDEKYLHAAMNSSKAFNYDYGNFGVKWKTDNGNVWYNEGGKIILNGHIYCLISLYDLYKITEDENIKKLFEEGFISVEKELINFDSGYWSYYKIDDPKIIASMMYHNLHIVQLQALLEIKKSDSIDFYIKQFISYANNPLKRIKALTDIVRRKISK